MNEGLELTLRDVFVSAGWRVEQSNLAEAGLSFDLVAESESTVAFVKVLSGPSRLGEMANQLTGEVAACMGSLGRHAKAWEAYLLLVLTRGYVEALDEVQRVQYDLT